MTEKKAFKITMRFVLIIAAVITIIAFFLPIVTIDAGKEDVSLSGWGMATGTEVTIKGLGSEQVDGSPSNFLFALAPVVILLVALAKKQIAEKATSVITIIFSVLEIILFNYFKSYIFEDVGIEKFCDYYDFDLKMGAGYVLPLVMAVLMSLVSVLVLLKVVTMDGDVKAAAIASAIGEKGKGLDVSSIKNALSSIELPTAEWTCQCGNVVKGGKFCPQCGTPKPEVPRCPKCGAKLSPDSKFCQKCGQDLSKPVESPKAEPASAPAAKPVCPGCGADIHEGDIFCEKCGTKLQ